MLHAALRACCTRRLRSCHLPGAHGAQPTSWLQLAARQRLLLKQARGQDSAVARVLRAVAELARAWLEVEATACTHQEVTVAGCTTQLGLELRLSCLKRWSGRRFRIFDVIDEFNHQGLLIDIDTSLPTARVIRALNELVEVRRAPPSIRRDNGPEFIADALAKWARAALQHI